MEAAKNKARGSETTARQGGGFDLTQKSPLLPPLPRLWAQTLAKTRCPCTQAVRPTHQLATERHYANGGGVLEVVVVGGLPSLSPSHRGPSLLRGSACLRALLLVLTERPLIVGISPACLAKLGEGDLQLL